MRKLLIKLVAIETALLGWLAYWLFLVYANNPSIADQLATSLQKFPQLSFSTVDIAVLVIIAALAVTLAFKFQRGLRPGIRLERALQMLESLMKRNLILESQVAELKIEKSHPGPLIAPPASTSQTPPPADEPRAGSWEKAFRTPLEAGPPSSRSTTMATENVPFGSQTGLPPPRIEPKPPTPQTTKPTIMITEKGMDRTSQSPIIIPNPAEKPGYAGSPSPSSSWEDSPKFIGESRGILTPSPPPRKVPSVSESGGLKQPYIPAPAPKVTPPNVIVGPMIAPTSSKPAASSAPPRVPRPSIRAIASPKTPPIASPLTSTTSNETPKPDATNPLVSTSSPVEKTPFIMPSPMVPAQTVETTKPDTPESKDIESVKPDEKTRTRDLQPSKKKSPTDEEE